MEKHGGAGCQRSSDTGKMVITSGSDIKVTCNPSIPGVTKREAGPHTKSIRFGEPWEDRRVAPGPLRRHAEKAHWIVGLNFLIHWTHGLTQGGACTPICINSKEGATAGWYEPSNTRRFNPPHFALTRAFNGRVHIYGVHRESRSPHHQDQPRKLLVKSSNMAVQGKSGPNPEAPSVLSLGPFPSKHMYQSLPSCSAHPEDDIS